MLTEILIIAPSVARFLCKSPIMLQIGTSVSHKTILKVGRRVVKLLKKILGGYFFPAVRILHTYCMHNTMRYRILMTFIRNALTPLHSHFDDIL